MKNLVPYTGNSFQFYKAVKAKKRDFGLKQRLTDIEDDLEQLFVDYDQHFVANTLHLLEPHGYTGQQKTDLDELYTYSSATLTKLRTSLTTTPTGRVVKCQNCTINDISTFDHLVPQGIYTEFTVHPKNLLCCCGDCNPRKGANWRANGRRTTLNLYLDQLPNVQYLFVNLTISPDSISTEFYLENVGNVDAGLFALLDNHYDKLNLFQRFSDSADTVITSFKTVFMPVLNYMNFNNARLFILETLVEEQLAFGFNYWQTILKMALINHPDFHMLLT